jgi:hypothetical protein
MSMPASPITEIKAMKVPAIAAVPKAAGANKCVSIGMVTNDNNRRTKPLLNVS